MGARRSKAPATQEATLKALLQKQDWEGLRSACQTALVQSPRLLAAHRLHGFALSKLRREEDALVAYAKAIRYWPRDAELLVNYSHYLLELARNAQAVPLLRTACELRPEEAKCWIKLSQGCYALQLSEEGFKAAQTAIDKAKTEGERVNALNLRAIHRRELGQVREAVEDCEAALKMASADIVVHSNRMLFLLADPNSTPAQQKTAALEYAASFEPALQKNWPDFAAVDPHPWRKLRIGFFSPDLRNHAVMYFVEGLLAMLDRRQFEVWAFHLHPATDHITERVKLHADHFVQLSNISANEQAQAVVDAQIDILIDLAGHTAHNGLLAMALKPAPVQVSWIGFPATTGLTAIDYKFTDEVTDPADADDQYSEKLYRLPTLFCCYRPLIRNPLWRYRPDYQVKPSPALAKGYVTFGSCNNLGKLTDEVLSLWGQILQANPTSRLLIEGRNFEKPEFEQAYRDRCAALGIDNERLELVPLKPANQYLTYHHIDIALDPFPLTGGTTSFDLLWMGVPMVSMEGSSFKSRLSTGILTKLGRSEWLAQTKEQYLAIACQLASDIPALNALRGGLRVEMEASVLMREDLFAHYFGEGLRLMWLQWLAQRQCKDDAEAQSALLAQWLQSFPADWQGPPPLQVGVRGGEKLPLTQAHARLLELLDTAKASGVATPGKQASVRQNKPHSSWVDVEMLAEQILCAHPHDALALTALAEIELAHGNELFAMTYTKYAQQALVSAHVA